MFQKAVVLDLVLKVEGRRVPSNVGLYHLSVPGRWDSEWCWYWHCFI